MTVAMPNAYGAEWTGPEHLPRVPTFPAGLLPRDVMVVCAGLDGDPLPLHPLELDAVVRARPVRLREFAMGRSCARRALRALGAQAAAIPRGIDRAPEWPAGVVGSISHCRGYCVAAVAWRAVHAGVGIDVERFQRLPADILSIVVSPSEADQLRALGKFDLAEWATVAFSAKEALYKCYYPLARRILEFHDVALTLTTDGGFTGVLQNADAPSAGGSRRFRGRFVVREGIVFAAVTVPAASGSV